jgi:hypothetical protein
MSADTRRGVVPAGRRMIRVAVETRALGAVIAGTH